MISGIAQKRVSCFAQNQDPSFAKNVSHLIYNVGKSAAAGHGQDQRESAVVKEYGSGSLGRWGHLGTIFIIVFMDMVVIFIYPNLLIILRRISQISNQMLLPRNVEKLSKLNLTHCGGFCGLLPKQWRIGRPTGTVDCLTNVNKLGAVADRIISEYEYQHNLFTNKKLFLAICQIYF